MKKLFKITKQPLRSKLIISYMIIIIIPFAALLCVVYLFLSQTMTSYAIRTAESNNTQVLKNVDTFLNSIMQLSEFTDVDSDLKTILSKNYSNYGNSSLAEQINDINTVDLKLYSNIYYMNNKIHSVLLFPQNSHFTYSTLSSHTNYLASARSMQWYKKIVAINGRCVVFGKHENYFDTAKSEVITVGRSIVDPLQNKFYGVIVINVEDSDFIDLWQDISITKNSFTALVDENYNLIYQGNKAIKSGNLSQIAQKSKLNKTKSWNFEQTVNGTDYFIIFSKTTDYGWRVMSVIPRNELFGESNSLITVIVLITIAMTACLVVLSLKIAKSITDPVKKLSMAMAGVENGNLDVKAEEASGEIGMLANSFNKMTSEMKRLITRIYKEENEKREADLIALQSQINPHFLYNTIESIKVLSQIQGAKGIANILDDLVKLLRASSKNTNELVDVREEVKLTESYIEIIRFRYFDRINFKFDIPDDILNQKTIKFLLQPIIENSVIHGFDKSKLSENVLIRIKRSGDRLIYQVVDNGIGMDRQKAKILLDGEEISHLQKFSKIGLNNVNQRIKMTFGRQYGISIKSRQGYYTNVEAAIPYVEGGDTVDKNTDCR
jgi:two-component system, sensor histidine kinase YesM